MIVVGAGAVALEMAGACWVLPEFYGRVGDGDMITTLKSHLTRRLIGRADETRDKDPSDALRELWGVDDEEAAQRQMLSYAASAMLGPAERATALLICDTTERIVYALSELKKQDRHLSLILEDELSERSNWAIVTLQISFVLLLVHSILSKQEILVSKVNWATI